MCPVAPDGCVTISAFSATAERVANTTIRQPAETVASCFIGGSPQRCFECRWVLHGRQSFRIAYRTPIEAHGFPIRPLRPRASNKQLKSVKYEQYPLLIDVLLLETHRIHR